MMIDYENGQSDTPPYPLDGMYRPNGGLPWE
jgi:hypothetical protein